MFLTHEGWYAIKQRNQTKQNVHFYPLEKSSTKSITFVIIVNQFETNGNN